MGCCNGSVLLLVICTLQLITLIEWIVFDFIGYLYLALIPSFIHIIIVIVAIFGLCLYKHRLIVVYLVWNIVYIAWTIFVICLYLGVGAFDENSYTILGFGSSVSWWIKFARDCMANDTCSLKGNVIEVIHAAIQALLSLVGCVSSSYVIYLLREKDDTSPIFQVYKAPSSRRSSISLRGDREATLTQHDQWDTPANGRDSIRSTRSTRSNRGTPVGQNGTRQSKRSNRGSTRSRHKSNGLKSSQNGSVKNKRPDSLPWAPTVAPSSGVDSDIPQTPLPHQTQVGHANESYGYGSSSDNPYSDYLQRTPNGISPGPPPGPVPVANRKYRPTNLSQSFNAVADLPPPLDEGPEAYSRDSVAFPAPPPPLADGPEPYISVVNSDTQRQSHAPYRPSQLTLHPPTPTKETLSSPSSGASSPGSSSLGTEKSGAMPMYNTSRTLENNLNRSSHPNKHNMYQRSTPPDGNMSNYHHQSSKPEPSHFSDGQKSHNFIQDKLPSSSACRKEPGDATSNPLYANHKFGQGNASDPQSDPQRSGLALALPSKLPYKQPTLGLRMRDQTTPRSGTDMQSDYEQASPLESSASQKSPSTDLRQMRGLNSQPKDNTFKRLVSGDLSQPPNGAMRRDNSPDAINGMSSHHQARSSDQPQQAFSARYNQQQIRPSTTQNVLSHAPQNSQQNIHQQKTYQHQPNTYNNPQPTGGHEQNRQHGGHEQNRQHGGHEQNRQYGGHEQNRRPTHLDHSHHSNSQPPQNTRPQAPYNPNRDSGNFNHTPGANRSPVSNVSAFNSNKHSVPYTPKQVTNASDSRNPPPTAAPPWEKSKSENTAKPLNHPMPNQQHTSNSVVPARQAATALNGTLTEVTSSYGGLYSSRQSPAPSRRRVNHRTETGPSNYHQYPLTNITDDVKTTKGPFISAQPSVI